MLPKKYSFNNFMNDLRRYKKQSFIDVAIGLSKIEESNFADYFPHCNNEKIQAVLTVLNAYAETVLLLALGACNDHRKKIVDYRVFHNFCDQYVGIDPCIGYSDEEWKNFNQEIKKYRLPCIDDPKNYTLKIFGQREMKFQNQYKDKSYDNLHMDFLILKDWQENQVEKKFFLSLKNLYTFAIILFCLGRDGFRSLERARKMLNKCGIDYEKAEKCLELLVCRNNDLKNWILEINKEDEKYKKYLMSPLVDKPVIGIEDNIFIFNYKSFFSNFRQAIFKKLYFFDKSFGSSLGEKIESLVGKILKEKFNSNIKKIEYEQEISSQEKEKADYFLKLKNINLIIEIKTSVGSNDLITLKPKSLAKLFSKLYKATSQCVSSSEYYKNRFSNPIINLIIIADLMVVDYMAFKAYCHNNKLFEDDMIQFISWSRLENILKFLTIEEFEEVLLKNMGDKSSHFENWFGSTNYDNKKRVYYPSCYNEVNNELGLEMLICKMS